MKDNKGKNTMWGGRFSENPDDFMLEFGASLDVDIELLDVDIIGSIAWVKALGKAGILSEAEVQTIVGGLHKVGEMIKSQINTGSFILDRTLEDVHMTVEAKLIEQIGELGAKIHTGRSRNDQIALDERLYLLRAIDSVTGYLKAFQETIVNQAELHINTIVPSYTHLQQAQPVRLGHLLMAWFWMMERDRGRFIDSRKRVDRMPLGSGAVAGTGFPVDREFLAEKLGFSAVTENSIDAVSDRDFIIETLSSASILMMHLSRIAEDLIIWSSTEFGFVILPENYSTGSSMMPQKKNPDSLELIRGKTGRVYGNLVSILTVMKGLPFSYCKDMQEDKEPLFDTLKTVDGCLRILQGLIEGIVFNTERMEASVDTLVFATDVADYLTMKGLPFRKAHEITGLLVKWCLETKTPMTEIPIGIFKEHSGLFENDVNGLFDLRLSTDRRSITGGTAGKSIVKQIDKARELLLSREDIA
ncbi:argininosuccinate lyase [Candidatus Latescibacterota bacterium]